MEEFRRIIADGESGGIPGDRTFRGPRWGELVNDKQIEPTPQKWHFGDIARNVGKHG